MASTPPNVNAQFGSGIVYDPTNFKNAVLRYRQLRMQLAQLQDTYNEIVNQYNLAVRMAKNIPNMPTRYLASWSPWRFASSQDLYGNTTTWVNGVNSGVVGTVLNGYTPQRRRSGRSLRHSDASTGRCEVVQAVQSSQAHDYAGSVGKTRPARQRARGDFWNSRAKLT